MCACCVDNIYRICIYSPNADADTDIDTDTSGPYSYRIVIPGCHWGSRMLRRVGVRLEGCHPAKCNIICEIVDHLLA